eukprot:CAMPEP_0201593630 /NCGR_PEP_ID=MMETSP0190_2-20130828/191177_1 /ASSEMBLY_ACC=CAM_ASM_000263 /TAXON_ID=37353 /ORGANISM="Rosalina sp." /LENGTH=407 /DNA_ID=CAMNT_0048052895 /DNA_START=124 /DNA_END=1347 /DNA_ORIENTATION=+
MSAPKQAMNTFADSIRGCMFGMFVGDSLAMPVHWYYNIRQLQYDFGEITTYQAPKYPFPGSIMNLSNTGGGGRGSDKGSIVGDVINHGKKKFWKKGGQYHYHHGLKPGENTLDAQVTKVLIESIIKNKSWNKMSFLNDYVKFMTTAGSHNDVYASSAHRMFFANWIKKKPLDQCPDNDNHNIDAIDTLTIIPPLVASMMQTAKSNEEIKSVTWLLVNSMRKPSNSVKLYVDNYVDLLYDIMAYKSQSRGSVNDGDDEEKNNVNVNNDDKVDESEIFGGMILNAANKLGIKKYVISQARLKNDPMVACYMDSSYPAMLVYAYKYYFDFNTAILASVNGGGENVARTTALGALFGAFYGYDKGIDKKFKRGLLMKDGVNKDIDEYIKLFGDNENEKNGNNDNEQQSSNL